MLIWIGIDQLMKMRETSRGKNKKSYGKNKMMAGWDSQEMLSALPDVLSLSTAAGESLGLTSDIVTKIVLVG